MVDIPQVGTRMTAAEFAQLPETTQRIELIDGEVIMSPTPRNKHQTAVFLVASYLNGLNKGTTVISPMDVYFEDDLVLQPDVFWVSGPDSACQLGSDDYWHGAPDLVVEVLSPSTKLRDRDVKFKHYAASGVCEYWLVEPEARFIEVFQLTDAGFDRVGIYEPDQTLTSPLLGAQVAMKTFFPTA